jgi:hypothetical protein
MAAHLIQMTAISHLSSEILGLEVNVVRERLYDLTESGPSARVTGERPIKRGQFLVYSSFATSALVAPHESLVEFWQRAFVADLVRRFASGPTLTDPRSPMPSGDQQRVQNLWQTLLTHLVSRFAALDNDRLEEAIDEINEHRGTWGIFWDPIQQTLRQALLETGIRGALSICEMLGPANTGAAPESLPPCWSWAASSDRKLISFSKTISTSPPVPSSSSTPSRMPPAPPAAAPACT